MADLNITNAAASAAILRAVEAGTLVQGAWHNRKRDGREIACLLGSIDPRVRSAEDCNGALMPQWMAELTVTLFDGIPEAEIYPIARRYGALVSRWDALSAAQWGRILTRVLVRCMDAAVDAARPVSEGEPYWPAVAEACAQVKTAIEGGDDTRAARAAASAAAGAASAAAWAAAGAASAAASAAAGAASAAAWAAAGAAAGAARAAAGAARAAAGAAAWAAAGAARAAAGAARAAAGAARAAAGAARAAAGAAAYLSLFNFVLGQIEGELP